MPCASTPKTRQVRARVAFEGPSQGEGFQIFVVPYAHSAITPERFRIDDPSGVMKEAKEAVVDGTPAKSFFGYNDQMGDTWEVWFIHGGFLYEVTTYKPLARLAHPDFANLEIHLAAISKCRRTRFATAPSISQLLQFARTCNSLPVPGLPGIPRMNFQIGYFIL